MKIGFAAVAPLVCVNAISANQIIAQTRIRILFISPPQVGRRNDKPNLLVKCSPAFFPNPTGCHSEPATAGEEPYVPPAVLVQPGRNAHDARPHSAFPEPDS